MKSKLEQFGISNAEGFFARIANLEIVAGAEGEQIKNVIAIARELMEKEQLLKEKG